MENMRDLFPLAVKKQLEKKERTFQKSVKRSETSLEKFSEKTQLNIQEKEKENEVKRKRRRLEQDKLIEESDPWLKAMRKGRF
ncbi:hypothetical protein [Exiguobacterium sp. s181]|uniref:hypothetical protein n=1 Tax=Exiguobacterium sp. s181 TaxID=2751288 RepID=UPI001BE78729|nr:hypothetical protein [Exiguobacterium sp. s181]